MSTMVVVRVVRDTQALLHLAVLEMRVSEVKRIGAEMQFVIASACMLTCASVLYCVPVDDCRGASPVSDRRANGGVL